MTGHAHSNGGLVDIPHFDLGSEGPLGLAHRAPDRLSRVMNMGRRQYGGLVLHLGDRFGRTWLKRNETPYGNTVNSVAAATNHAGAIGLNLSYDFACTTAVAADPDGSGNRMLRTLDWPLKGLGREVVAASHAGPAGPYSDVTWPGFVGITTAMAPGRFSAAINQPPARRFSPLLPLDAVTNRWLAWRQTAMPPVHLLRHVFETCKSYSEAKAVLATTPISIPAFFTLSGTASKEGCVIERTETDSRTHAAPISVSNHWIGLSVPGRDRGTDSHGRRTLMERLRDSVSDTFDDWVQPPILNATTRLAVVANAARGTLAIRGYEPDGTGSAAPATTDFALP